MERYKIRIKGLLLTHFLQSAFLSLVLLASSVSAVETSAENTFLQGVKAFKSGEYQRAEALFLDAKKQGYTDLQIDYNLGVAAFKQSKYQDAVSHFNKLTSHPEFSAIARYNIGLSLERQGKTDEARKFFKQAASDQTNEKIRYLAQKKLDDKEQAPPSSIDKIWDIYASIAYGYDDNVKLVAEDLPSGKEDSYVQAYASARVKTPIDARIYANFYDINYEDFDEENYRNTKIGIDYPFKLNDWKYTPAIEYSESELDGEDYLDITDYRIKARKRLGKNSLTLSYRYSDIDPADNQYDYLEGDRHRVRINYRMPVAIGKLRLRYQFETNDREDTATRSYSPDRHSVEAKLSHALQKSWEVYVNGNYRNSDYPTKAGNNRNDDRYRFTVGTDYYFNETWSINAKYEYTDNKSNRSVEEYTRNAYLLSLNGSF